MGQLLSFFLVGLANTVVGLFCIWITMWLMELNELAANFVGYFVGLVLSYSLNRTWTFADTQKVSGSFPRWFFAAMLAYFFNLAVVIIAIRQMEIDPYLAQLLGIVVYASIMFLAGRYYVFNSPDLL